jgi:cobalamin synthase
MNWPTFLREGSGGPVAAGATLLVTLLFAWYSRRKIGGATGDVLGASCELAETAVILTFSIPYVKCLPILLEASR